MSNYNDVYCATARQKYKAYCKSQVGVQVIYSRDYNRLSEFWRLIEQGLDITVCQTLGIKDVSGVEVYEGDIVDGGHTGREWVIEHSYFGNPFQYHVSNGINSGREISRENSDQYSFSANGKDEILLKVIGSVHEQ